jgi:hypothetical protein
MKVKYSFNMKIIVIPDAKTLFLSALPKKLYVFAVIFIVKVQKLKHYIKKHSQP